MAQNTLKQKAREFAKNHGVSYLTALGAVDEPFHELRDLIRSVRPQSDSLREHFRLIGNRGPFSAAYPTPDTPELKRLGEYAGSRDHLRTVLESQGLPRLSESEFFVELGRRTDRLQRSEADDIWGYRELHRAGLVDRDEPILEPIFHYYYSNLWMSFRPLTFSGPNLGIFGVNMSKSTQITEPYRLIPITVDQLDALRFGRPLSSPVEFPLAYRPQKDAQVLRWKQSYVAAYDYYDVEVGDRGSSTTLLLKSPVADLKATLLSMELEPSHFSRIDDFPVETDLDHALDRDMLVIGSGDQRRWLSTPGLIILG